MENPRVRSGLDETEIAQVANIAHALGHDLIGGDDWRRHAGSQELVSLIWAEQDQIVQYGEARIHKGRWQITGPIGYQQQADRLAGLEALIGAASSRIEAPVDWWVEAADSETDEVARQAKLSPTRQIYQMRVPLPLTEAAAPSDFPTRSFRPSIDDDAWLDVNNRAFAWHEDQAGWTHSELDDRFSAAWFDATGFLLHEMDGRLAGFCWTKIHATTDPVLGEIYAIGVDPDFQGLGLGRALTVAGLRSIANRGVTTGVLYVEADNEAGVGLYRSLGFRVHHSNRRYSGFTLA